MTFPRLIILSLAAFALTASASKPEKATNESAPMVRTDYHFKHAVNPRMLRTSGPAAYTAGGQWVHNLSGAELLRRRGFNIVDLEVSPANNRFVLIYNLHLDTLTAIFSVTDPEFRPERFKDKRFGGQTAAVLYSPDARRLLVANHKGQLMTADARTRMPVDTMLIHLDPKRMALSPNEYYLAMTDGKEVMVYNMHDKNRRAAWKYESPVTDIEFNDDSSELAVLTSDGLLSIYDTRTFIIKRDLDDLGDALAMDYNFDGKYIAVATAADTVKVINVLNPTAPESTTVIPVEGGGVVDLGFFPDSDGRTLLGYTGNKAMHVRRMWGLEPYYGKLIRERADAAMNEWMQMMPGETLDQYRQRVNDDTRRRQRMLFEAQFASEYAPSIHEMATISLGKYDRDSQMLQLNFSNMPSILLRVAESDLGAFNEMSAGRDLRIVNAKYGVMPDDSFELIFAEIYNAADGKTYVFDNIERASLQLLADDDNVMSIEVVQQQQMEGMKLQQLREQVLDEARQQQTLSEHTRITANSELQPAFDANGNRILNYRVKFSYEVEPDYSEAEDFAPGKYRAEQSHAASAMLRIVKEAFEGDLKGYIKPGKRVTVNISGSADAKPIRKALAYDGVYGDFEEEPVRQDGVLKAVTVNEATGIPTNEQLAFVRAAGVKNFLDSNVGGLGEMATDYQYNIDVSKQEGSQFRRITIEFLFFDAFDL